MLKDVGSRQDLTPLLMPGENLHHDSCFRFRA